MLVICGIRALGAFSSMVSLLVTRRASSHCGGAGVLKSAMASAAADLVTDKFGLDTTGEVLTLAVIALAVLAALIAVACELVHRAREHAVEGLLSNRTSRLQTLIRSASTQKLSRESKRVTHELQSRTASSDAGMNRLTFRGQIVPGT